LERRGTVNYRHAYHAGNFADLLKHAALLSALGALKRGAPLTVVDTHAGAGIYDLTGGPSRASGEAEAGVGRLMADADPPPSLAALKTAVRRLNPKGPVRLYPGSPRLIADALRPGDRLVACELRADDGGLLRQALKGRAAEVLRDDGYAVVVNRARSGQRLLVLIDPPFERADEHERAAEAALATVRRDAGAVVIVWLPLKDLETFDGFLRRLEAGRADALVVEARLRPLDDPMKMNGCALVVLGAPEGFEAEVAAAAHWIVRRCGGAGGEARVWRLG
jgi:23S rRNA (adenine2030-N6)-methyltransferase